MSRVLFALGALWVAAVAQAVPPCSTTTAPALTCDGAGWQTQLWSTDPQQLQTYTCAAPTDQDGPERVFPITCPYDTLASVYLSDTSCNLDLFVMDDTCGGSCLGDDTTVLVGAGEVATVEFVCLAGQTYYASVEGYDLRHRPGRCSAGGGYRYSPLFIGMVCEETGTGCQDGFDNDADGLLDCDDDDCTCPEDCAAPGDEDHDGLANCADSDCSGTEACCDVDDDGSPREGGECGGSDCDDADPRVSPGAAETPADGVDQDCDGGDVCWSDDDDDLFGDLSLVASANLVCGDVAGESAVSSDCDDDGPDAADRFPGNAEVPGDDVDQDCDGVDTCFRDLDDDGFGAGVATAATLAGCSAPGWAVMSADCLDAGAGAEAVFPGAVEICDGLDNNCDGRFDADDPLVQVSITIYPDGDGDGYGVLAGGLVTSLCGVPPGYAARAGDCDDLDPARSPGIVDVPYDTLDQDCSGGDLLDVDGDGYDGPSATGPDCDDSAPPINLTAGEKLNGYDDDCDGLVDEATSWFDDDGDGFAEAGGDCDDASAQAHPGAQEVCDDADSDCDGLIDDGTVCVDDDRDGYSELDGDCNDQETRVSPGVAEVPGNGIDDDCDGHVDAGRNIDVDGDGYAPRAGDCDDNDPGLRPGVPELEDGVDNDCDGRVDEGTILADDDGDGFAEVDGDCNDRDAATFPGAEESRDGRDNDCDRNVDEVGPHADDDRDGWTPAQGDCDDSEAYVSPFADEVPGNAVDDDCDGVADEFTDDLDRDGFTARDGDCDDMDAWVHAGLAEDCDGADNDCNGQVDDGIDCTTEDPGRGGCDTAPAAPALGGLVAALLAFRRRRPGVGPGSSASDCGIAAGSRQRAIQCHDSEFGP